MVGIHSQRKQPNLVHHIEAAKRKFPSALEGTPQNFCRVVSIYSSPRVLLLSIGSPHLLRRPIIRLGVCSIRLPFFLFWNCCRRQIQYFVAVQLYN